LYFDKKVRSGQIYLTNFAKFFQTDLILKKKIKQNLLLCTLFIRVCTVHRVYISSNLKSLFIVHKYDQLESCNCYNLVMSSFSSFVLKKHVKIQEEEQCWLLTITCPSTKLKPKMVCCEGENDEDMTPLDMTIDYKVSLFIYSHNDF